MSQRTLAALLALLLAGAGAGTASAQGRPGSIYDVDAGPLGLIADKTARRSGDLLTVIISENQDIANEETSDLLKSSSLNYQLESFNIKPNAFNVLPDITSSSEDSLKGTANYKKKDKFTARLTAIVIDVLPGGNLVISGRREIRIDQETRLIEFSGVVRRFDVKPDNTIVSELVADARVSYTGRGPMTLSTNRVGLNRLVHDALNWLWPF